MTHIRQRSLWRYLTCVILTGCTSGTLEVESGAGLNMSDIPQRDYTPNVPQMRMDATPESAGEDLAGVTPDDEDLGAINLRDMSPPDPCVGVNCGEHGVCVAQDDSASCSCDPRYEPSGLSCLPEDLDRDGVDFTQDCDDQQANISPNEAERCDEVDQDCDGVIDEGACGIWVLEPRANRWTSHPLDVNGSVNVPQGPIKAAWDIETEDLAFVLTESGYHELRLSSLSWSPERPRGEVFEGVDGPIERAAFAYSIPADHGGGSTPRSEGITIFVVDQLGDKRVWQLRYVISEGRFIREAEGLYNSINVWSEAHAPTPSAVRASWIDLENNRFLLNANPSALCGGNAQLSNIYTGLMTADQLHLIESGWCFLFLPPTPVMGSPLDLPNAPRFDEVGAAFFHQGTFYLFRGD